MIADHSHSRHISHFIPGTIDAAHKAGDNEDLETAVTAMEIMEGDDDADDSMGENPFIPADLLVFILVHNT